MTKCWIGFIRYDGVRKDAPFGWKVIRWFSNDDTVHVFLTFKKDDEPAVVYETTETLYHEEAFKSRALSPVELYQLPFDGEKLREECHKLLGAPYDYTGIAALGLYLLMERGVNWVAQKVYSWMGLKKVPDILFIGNPFHVGFAYFCSEAVIKCLNAAQPGYLPTWWAQESIFPKTIRNFFNESFEVYDHRGLK